jgi:thiol-disulfide isomerase/thioredoxin
VLPRLLVIALAGALLATGCRAAREREPASATTPSAAAVGEALGAAHGLVPGARAPEFAGLEHWLNSEPLTLAGLAAEGRVVLVDFWTYTCVNCLRTLPYLASWHEKYGARGLTIVGVHSPEFDFEQSPENVARAVRDLEVRWPVAQDNAMATWDAFHNNAWPAKYLIGEDGVVLYRHVGEGAYEQTEQAIRAALTAAGHDVRDIPEGGPPPPRLDPAARGITRELYGGYARSYHPLGVYAAQDEYYLGPDLEQLYVDPGPPRRPHQWYAHGLWRNEREAIVHARETEALEDYLAFAFVAGSVNVVMHSAPGGTPYVVVIEIDGRPLAAHEAGADVTFDAAGRSIVTVAEPRMYALVRLPSAGEHELRLRSNARGFAMYAVTFGAYLEGA